MDNEWKKRLEAVTTGRRIYCGTLDQLSADIAQALLQDRDPPLGRLFVEAFLAWLVREGRIAEQKAVPKSVVQAVELSRMRAERDEALQRVQELEREKYGTPCKCEEWIAACRKAEAEVERLRAALSAEADSRRRRSDGRRVGG